MKLDPAPWLLIANDKTAQPGRIGLFLYIVICISSFDIVTAPRLDLSRRKTVYVTSLYSAQREESSISAAADMFVGNCTIACTAVIGPGDCTDNRKKLQPDTVGHGKMEKTVSDCANAHNIVKKRRLK